MRTSSGSSSCLGWLSVLSVPPSLSAPPTSRAFFPRRRRGFAMGVFGAGTTGAAINMFIAPVLIAQYGWQVVPRVYAVALLLTAVIFWLLSAPDTNAPGKSGASLRQQLAVFKDLRDRKSTRLNSSHLGISYAV